MNEINGTSVKRAGAASLIAAVSVLTISLGVEATATRADNGPTTGASIKHKRTAPGASTSQKIKTISGSKSTIKSTQKG